MLSTIGSLPIPVLAADHVLLDIHAFGVNPVETYIRSGTHAVKPSLPYTPGNDAAGVVVAVGSGVSNVKVRTTAVNVLYRNMRCPRARAIICIGIPGLVIATRLFCCSVWLLVFMLLCVQTYFHHGTSAPQAGGRCT